jgi:hypothetical protein
MVGAVPLAEVLRAIAIFVEIAYPDDSKRPPPAFESLPADLSAGDFAARFQRLLQPLGGSQLEGQTQAPGFTLRVGNAEFPNMKIMVRPTEEPPGFVLAVDTHDSIDPTLVRPEQRDDLKTLKEHNRAVARAAARAWEAAGLPTQASLLKRRLENRT